MKGDFSRDSFDPMRHFIRVLMQQGRVQLDADFNEQVSILLHYIQALAADIIGPYAGPVGNDYGFNIEPIENQNGLDFSIGKGRYYVNGILCENYPSKEISYLNQPDFPTPPEMTSGKRYVVYLDVWERHITFIEDDDIREKALGGSDTATRSKIVWQVKVKELLSYPYSCIMGAGLLDGEMAVSKACMRACVWKEQEKSDLCIVESEAGYRGAENQFYRVEVHDGGSLQGGQKPTFKWSRENGSVVFPIKGIRSNESDTVGIELDILGREGKFSLGVNDWVEIEDDAYVLKNIARPLLQVQKIDYLENTVTLTKKKDENGDSLDYYLEFEKDKHPLLRRWDHKKGVLPSGVLEIQEADNLDENWLEIEDGIEIQFKKNARYRTGDFWNIPARNASRDVDWPSGDDNSGPKFLPPRGVIHHIAPLAIVSVNGNSVDKEQDCRCNFRPLSHACSYSYYGQLGIGIGTDLLCPDAL